MLPSITLLFALTGALLAPTPTLDAWTGQYGAPSKSAEDSDRVRSDDEPLLVYWMRTQAAPLGIGPALPGTLVANFTPAKTLRASHLASYTFLAMAQPEQTTALLDALKGKGWIAGDTEVQRPGGTFTDYRLATDGLAGTLSVRKGEAKGSMADGRPAPSLWLHVKLGD